MRTVRGSKASRTPQTGHQERDVSWLSISPSNARFALIDALNAEWTALNGEGWTAAQYRRQLARWSGREKELAGCHRPEDVLAAIRRSPDEVLAALISLHQNARPVTMSETARSTEQIGHWSVGESELAGRIVLQTMLGKLVAMAQRDHHHGIEDYVGTFWGIVGGYCLSRRPRRIAANLALDTLKQVTRDHGRVKLVPSGDRLDGLTRPASDGQPVPSLSARRVLHTAYELGLIDDPTCQLLTSVYADGMSGRQAADAFGLTPTTVRYRCSKAVRRLAAHAQDLDAA